MGAEAKITLLISNVVARDGRIRPFLFLKRESAFVVQRAVMTAVAAF